MQNKLDITVNALKVKYQWDESQILKSDVICNAIKVRYDCPLGMDVNRINANKGRNESQY